MTIIDQYSKNTCCYSVTIELCESCNWKCKHCYLPKHKHKGIGYDSLIKLLHELRKIGVFELVLTGGEIFTRPDIIEIIEFGRKLGFHIILLTNCSLITEDIIQKLLSLNVTTIETTIFSLDSNIHDGFVESSGALHRSLKAVLRMKELNFRVKVKTIIMNFNYDEYIDIENFCIEHHIDYLLTPDVYKKNNGDLFPLDLRVSDKQLEEIINHIDKNNGYVYENDNNDSYVCKSTRYSLFIDSRGNIQPCGNYKYYIGNITQGIENVWNNSSILHKIQDTKYKDVYICKKCNKKENCSVCFGIIQDYSNSICRYVPLESDCKIAKIRNNISRKRKMLRKNMKSQLSKS